MKLRIKGNSIRLRLTKSEIEHFKVNGLVEEAINFGSGKLIYRLQCVNDDITLKADFKSNIITVFMSEKLKHDWTTIDWVGYDANVLLPDGSNLFILVEKDFKCLDATTEDQSDMFENPLSHLHK